MLTKWCVPLLSIPSLLLPAQNPAPTAPVPGAPQARPEVMLLPQIVVLPRGKTEISVDGALTEWPELPGIRLDDRRQISGTAHNAWRGPDDLGAIAFMMWDDEALWFGCAVRDDWHRALEAATLALSEIPVADSVVLTFDPERNTRAIGPDPGRREDREFWLADEAGRQVVQWDRLRGSARVLEEAKARVVVLHDKQKGITSYEARLPWSEILPVGKKPTVGDVLDVQIVINDFDETTDSMPQTRAGLTFGVGPIVDPGLLASLMLVPDASALNGVVPTFPPKPGTAQAPLPGKEFWEQLSARLVQNPPVVHDGKSVPADCGGTKRLAVLEAIEEQVASFPRVDFLEFHQRIHRRMLREVAGYTLRGLPSWWRQRLQSVSKQAEDPVPEGAVRVFRLPTGGWLFRSATRNFLVDPSGADLAEFLWGATEFCILTQPLDMTTRNDQLLVGMFTAEPPRPAYHHIAFHLPLVPMERMPLAELGKTYGQASGIQLHVLGKPAADGTVPYSGSYRIELPKGPRLLLVGQNLRAEDVGEEPVDLLLLSPLNAEAVAIVRKVKPAMVFLDGAFACQSQPTLPRITLRQFHAMQAALQPTPSVLLAPGESWDVKRQ